MAVSTDNTKAFTDAIKRLAAEECRQMDAETKQIRSQSLTLMKREIRHRYDMQIDSELSRIKADVNRQLALASEQSKTELSALRTSLSDKVFEGVLGKIDEFVKTDGYTALLIRSIGNIDREAEGSQIQYRLCERDMSLKPELEKALGRELDIVCDGDIAVGGVRAYCAETNLLLDDTLDVRLDAQREWFYENSGLKV